jgi:HK97 family phage prohead protease
MPITKKVKPSFSVSIKEIGEDGSFEGLLASYNSVDLGGDLIEPGAFTKTIKEHGAEVPLLWQHEPKEPIGSLSLIDGPDGLRVKGQLLMELPMAKKAYLLLKARIIKGMSIGYDTIKDAMDGKVRRLKELRLWEGSIVTFPMNENAMVTAIKALREQKDDFNAELAQIQLRDTGDQLFIALRYALCGLPWQVGISKEKKVAAAEATLQQFSEAYLAYLPLYIDYLTEEYGDMETMSRGEMEKKAGREFSAANMKTLKEAHDHVKSLNDIFGTLLDDPADDEDEDEEDKSADVTGETKAAPTIPEPEKDHSETCKLLDDIKALVQENTPKSDSKE